MLDDIDLLVVGAGPVGCVIAEQAAVRRGWRVLVVERRNHVAGNCHDRFHDSGVMVHQYGPHYFRSNSAELIAYLSKYTEWLPGNYIVESFVRGQMYPFPINLDTLEKFFGGPLTAASAEALLAAQRVDVGGDPDNSEAFVLSRVGRALYEAFYLNYTLKQWGQHPRDLAASVCGRIPVRLDRDPRYVSHRFQVMPRHGFTRLFTRMLDQPTVSVLLQSDYRELRRQARPRVGTVFCGPVDEYFDRRLGALPWRSLDFTFEASPVPFKQHCVQVNYPNDFGYTRSVEIKHVTGQLHPHTVLSYEVPTGIGDPYYPVPAAANRALYARYAELAEAETRAHRVFFAGRLARYCYMNTDEAIESALATFETILETHAAQT